MKNILIIGPSSTIAKSYIKHPKNALNNILQFSFSDPTSTIQTLQERISNENFHSVIYFANKKIESSNFNTKESTFINVELPIQIAQVCQRYGSQFLVFSSTRIFDEKEPFVRRKADYSAETEYGRQKVDLELGVSQYNSKVLRLTKVLSKDDDVWLNWSRSITLGIQTLVYKNKYISPIFLHEVVLAIDKVLGLNDGNIFQFSRSTELSYEMLFKDFINYSSKKISKPININSIDFINSTETHSSLNCDAELVDCLGNFDTQYEEFVRSFY
jgi:dTDP-4-dehydrorhamnose reductase